MIEILNRWTRVQIYKSETAQTIAEAVAEAMKSGANLEGANLRGANLEGANLRGANLEGAYLEGAKNILRLSGGRHDVIANADGRVYIGCYVYPIERWLESYKAIEKKEGYSDDEISDYGERLKLAASWIERQKAKQPVAENIKA